MQFIDLAAQRERIRDRLKAAIDRVVEDGRYILGPEVGIVRKAARGLCRRQARRGLRQRDGRAAAAADGRWHRPGRRGLRAELHLCRDRRSGGTGQGRAGLRRHRSGQLQHRHPASLEAAIAMVRHGGPSRAPKAIIPVDLFGLAADYEAISAIAAREKPDGHRGCRAGHRRHGRRAHVRRLRRRRLDQLLPGQAARLLRRRRRDVHQRRRDGGQAALARPSTARARPSTTTSMSG